MDIDDKSVECTGVRTMYSRCSEQVHNFAWAEYENVLHNGLKGPPAYPFRSTGKDVSSICFLRFDLNLRRYLASYANVTQIGAANLRIYANAPTFISTNLRLYANEFQIRYLESWPYLPGCESPLSTTVEAPVLDHLIF